jgi:transposase-like protein
MSEQTLALAGSFCWNPQCPDYAKPGRNNLVKNGHTRKGIQRYHCKTCQKTFAATKGTVFYGRHHSLETMLECLALLAERTSLAAIHRVKGVKEETLLDWLHQAAQHTEEIETLLMAHHHLTRVQLDALWTYVGPKGQKGGDPKRQNRAISGAARPSM